ncbi:MAG: tRNA pseudouridine(38-40) synthase TruA [Acidobacteriota bacterium]
MPTWKLTIEYEGTRYHGWQEQKNARTIAGEIRRAAEDFFKAPVELSGAGRTDAGVHALGQVARLRAAKMLRPLELIRVLNDRLPSDINILSVEEARHNFHPRHDAVLRFYLYQISRRRSAFAKKYVWWIKDSLDIEKMQQAACLVSGRHDFVAFSDKREEEKSTIVVVEGCELKVAGDLIVLRIGASHFLWKMVRRIVGALAAVGRGNLAVEQFSALLDSRREAAKQIFDIAANTAPPSGLFLEKITYTEKDKPLPIKPTLNL